MSSTCVRTKCVLPYAGGTHIENIYRFFSELFADHDHNLAYRVRNFSKPRGWGYIISHTSKYIRRLSRVESGLFYFCHSHSRQKIERKQNSRQPVPPVPSPSLTNQNKIYSYCCCCCIGAVRGVRRAGQFVLDLRAGTVDSDAGHTRIGRPRRVLVLLPLRKPGEAFLFIFLVTKVFLFFAFPRIFSDMIRTFLSTTWYI